MKEIVAGGEIKWKPVDLKAALLLSHGPQEPEDRLAELAQAPIQNPKRSLTKTSDITLADYRRIKRSPKPRTIQICTPSIIRAFWMSQGIPSPLAEYQFHLERKWRFDWAWPVEKIALEVDGGNFVGGAHVRGARILLTHEKENEAACLGWRILKCVPREILTMKVAQILKRALRVL